jgi:hypothetical protein
MLFASCAVVLAFTATAQTIGSYVLFPDAALDTSGIVIGGPPPDPARTYINLTAPAKSNATIRVVTFRLSGASPLSPCVDSVKVKFFRRGGNQLVFFAERGPFTVNTNVMKVTLPTPVDVLSGDVIGITLVRDCPLGGYVNGPIAQTTRSGASAFIQGDATGAYAIGAGTALPQVRLLPNLALSVFGSSNADEEIRSQVIVVAGSASGVGGSRFKTDVQMANVPPPQFIFNAPLRGDLVKGRLVYHAAGSSGSPSDVSVPFSLNRGESKNFLDFVGALGRSGIGSIDIYTTVGFEPPLAVAHIYEDSGSATKGLTLEALIPERALIEDAVLFAPSDPSRFRMNIGIRTLDRPARLGFVIFRANGTARTDTISVDLPANYFVQNEAGQLLGTTLQAGDTIVVRSDGAPVFVYGAITDNASQDPSVHFATIPR